MTMPPPESRFRRLKVALIADELTACCLAAECRVCHVTPLNYRLIFSFWQPDLLFVESAWQGRRNAWKYRVAAYPGYPQRSNRLLQQVVQTARDRKIPTVFWNKEDGVHFDRFISSAALFEHVFTVDANCLESYRRLLAPETTVEPLLFAVQPRLHSPGKGDVQFRRACFAGSYSHHIHDRRRRWQDLLFRAAAPLGVTAYDRNADRKSANYRYPAQTGLIVRPGVHHSGTAQLYRDYLVSLNVNTIEDSPTMFSRRLIEILACGGLAVTTPARSVDALFADYCHIAANEETAADLFSRLRDGRSRRDREMAMAGAEYVLQQHTWDQRLEQILAAIN